MAITLESYTLLNSADLDIVWSIDIYGDYIYIGTDSGLHIFNISDKTSPSFVRTILGGWSIYVPAVRVYGDYLFLGVTDYDASPNWQGVQVYDLTDPENPSEVSRVGGQDGGADDHLSLVDYLKKDGNRLYAASEWGPGLTVIDVTDPTNISELGYTIDVKIYGNWVDRYSMVVRNNIVYLVGESYFGVDEGLIILDCTNPASIVRKGMIAGVDDTDMVGCLSIVFSPTSNDYVLVGTDVGLTTVDITDVDNPASVSTFATTPTKYGNWGLTDIKNNNLYITGYETVVGNDNIYLTSLDVSNPLSISQGDTAQSLGVLSSGDGLREVIIAGDYIYVASFAHPYLWIFSDPSTVTLSGTVSDEWGNPIRDADITISNGMTYTTTSDENGAYSQVVNPDTYDIAVSKSHSTFHNTSESVSVTADTTKNITMPTDRIVGKHKQKGMSIPGGISL